ncbi:MAG: primosomal protein N', partial [Betaproteobacteria bacterium]|nr:primosomal protein N' [Betaproteobacteria bacterium]
MRIVRVGLDLPVDTLFDYGVDDATATDVGCRVLVPFGRRTAMGVVLELAQRSRVPLAQVKPVLRVLRDEPALGAADLRLLRFAAEYYHHPLGAVVMNTLPQRLRRVKAPRAAPARYFALTVTGESAQAGDLPARALVQRRLLVLFKVHGTLDQDAIRGAAATAPGALRRLVARGWVEPRAAPAARTPVPVAGPPLTAEQAAAAQAVTSALGDFQAFLLRGITGSGKTEVYLHAIKA